MSTKYVAAPGRAIPGGWPEDGRPIDELSQFHRRMVKDGDLIAAKPAKKKDDANDD
ncbi:hypothetical protein LAC81_15065 [Ensifer adhaerens]|uniref:hypothetical protein n=1 Tax=Ensifer adhaerens TaxID=106592 RepID=UPI001CBC5445|nr:hypothetical protein [Ensifer adhaerens]MBZ7923110.1 hypothetical protein [Ensifer adhaerens]UAX91700.1 hypothetical protein LAC78_15060 [Ensifer adhaerens]UAX99328.1 hypothetical protein LAC80_15065 [Ensifer adhaerens]UAY06711.1 hypothetical protein LAC81_15065 [Ensifer adhaerens]